MRIWQVKEQTVEDPSTKLRLEFSSVYTDELNAGNEPPAHDALVVLRLWTSDRTRLATFTFERNGQFVKCDVEPHAQEYTHVDEVAKLNPPPAAPALTKEGLDSTIAQTEEVVFGKAAFSGL